jgi:hypothetical protein
MAAAGVLAIFGARAIRRAADRAAMKADRPETVDLAIRCDGNVSLDDDPANCGRCGHDCCGGACEHGVCQPAVIAQGYHPGKLAVDESHVYWPDGKDTLGRIMKTPKRGGASVALASGQHHPWAVAVHEGFAYWVTNSNVAPTYGGLFKVPVGGGEVVALVPSGEAFANGVFVNDAGVFWDDYGEYTPAEQAAPVDGCARGARVRKLAFGAVEPTTLASPESGVCTPLLLAVDAHDVYWPNRFSRTIERVAIGGGRADVTAQSSDPVAVAVQGSYVYWVNWRDGTVQRASVDGGSPTTIATSGADRGPNGGAGGVDLVVDASTVYWAREGPPWGSTGAILFASTDSPPADEGSVLATSPSPDNLTMDARCIYWADAADGKVRAVAKP